MKTNHYFKNAFALIIGIAMLFAIGCQKSEVTPETETSDVQEFKSEPIPGQYIVLLNEDAYGRQFNKSFTYSEQVAAFKFRIVDDFFASEKNTEQIKQVFISSVVGFAAELTDDELARLRNDNRVQLIEQDQIVSLGKPSNPGNGKGGNDGGGEAPAQVTPWGITRVGGAVDGTGKTAWIIDSGIDLDHPDLNVDVVRSISMLSGNKQNKSPDDQNGHGTHVAGTVAALDNGIGVVGVAPNALVVAVRVLDRNGSGTLSGVIAGVDYVAANAHSSDVANMSLGGGVSTTLDQAVQNAAATGVRFAVAAGNSSADANNYSPARANGTNIYTVSAMDENDVFAYFSNYGNPPIDYCAPGVAVHSTWKDGGYNTISGTSMASPHVAGLLFGAISSDGYVLNDPDGNPDPIAHR